MIGSRYWYTGITVRHLAGEGWAARLDFLDDGFAESGSTQGTLTTRYFEATLSAAVDLLRGDADRLGLQAGTGEIGPTIYYEGDGESADAPPPPNWRQLLAAECARIGWEAPTFYEVPS